MRRWVTEHGWWLAATTGVALVITTVTGWWLLPFYALANATGTALYLDGLHRRPVRLRRTVLPLLTVAMVPVGILSSLVWRRVDPIDDVLGDEGIRNATAGANVDAANRHGGSG